jgi:hypothetical protein
VLLLLLLLLLMMMMMNFLERTYLEERGEDGCLI